MTSLVYGLAGLGSVEESKLYKEKFPDESGARRDSLAEETERALLGKSKEDEEIKRHLRDSRAKLQCLAKVTAKIVILALKRLFSRGCGSLIFVATPTKLSESFRID